MVQENKGSSRLWIVVKSLKDGIPGAELTEGDVLRFGKVPMVVKRVCGAKERLTLLREKKTLGKQDTSENNETHTMQEPGQCRICLGETYTIDNPFINPCGCDGSMKYIHLQCLREWLKSKLTVRESGSVVTYSWHPMCCELCKEPFPETVKCNSATFDLIDFHQPDLSYLMLEDLHPNTPDTHEKLLYIISLYENDSIRIVPLTQGRGHDSEIRISDISVSRLHATVKYKDGRFVLEDRNSKFGTLVQARGGVQVGRTVIELSVVRDVSALFKVCFCCIRSPTQVLPAGDTFAENEREQLPDEDRADSEEAISHRSAEANQGTVPHAEEHM